MTRCRRRTPANVFAMLASTAGLAEAGETAMLRGADRHPAEQALRQAVVTADDPGHPAAVRLAGDAAAVDVPVQGGRLARAVAVRQRPVTDDPVVSMVGGGPWVGPVPPEMPPQPPDVSPTQGAFALLPAVRFAPIVDAELAPGASREVELPVDTASVLLASARWIGTASPLQVSLSLDGTTLATGTGRGAAGDGGRAVLQAMTAGPGRGALSVTNTSDETVALRLVLGALDRRTGEEE